MLELDFKGDRWREVSSKLHWVPSFNKWLRLAPLPQLRGDTLYITSDYSGQDRGSAYEVVSVLIADLVGSNAWESQRRVVRRDFLADGRRMAFKKLNDRQRRQALVPFLSAADSIDGLCLVVGIHKRIRSLCSDDRIHREFTKSGILQSRWRFQSFERMARIVHFVSLLIGGLATPGQNIYWISDEDEMLGGPKRCEDTRKMLSMFSSLYVPFKLGELGIGTTALDEGDRLEEDFAALPDLAAGATAELLSTIRKTTGGSTSSQLAVPVPPHLSAKSNLLIAWLEDNSHPLKRVKLVFDSHGGKGFSLGPFRTDEAA